MNSTHTVLGDQIDEVDQLPHLASEAVDLVDDDGLHLTRSDAGQQSSR